MQPSRHIELVTGKPKAKLIACHECDLLQREVHLPLGGIVRCGRCGAELYRSHPDSFDRSLALTAGAIVLFILANSFPIVGLKLQGQVIQTTLFHTVQT
ncbi:MAG TPA: paraquat-inducible protein A, partial [Burkholderiales bacterium]|nr:paraquat-inducible protein A [Burkholderiales bacterium]